MAYLKLRNYNDSYFQYNLPVAVIGNAFNIPAGTFTDANGISWTVTRSGSDPIQVQITTTNRTVGLNTEKVHAMLTEKGFGSIVTENLLNKLSAGTDIRLGTGAGSVTYPLIRLIRTDRNPNPNNHTIELNVHMSKTSTSGWQDTGSCNVLDAPQPILAIFAVQDLNTWLYGDAVASFTNYGSTGIYGTVTLRLARSTFTSDTFAPLAYTPGEKGFRPTSDRTTPNRPGVGGEGASGLPEPQYKSDPISQPGEPDETHASATGSGFIKAYEVDENNLASVGANLWGTNLMAKIEGLFVNPLDFIVSLAIFPYTPHKGTATPIKFGRWKCINDPLDEEALGATANGNPLTQQYRTIDFGTINIEEEWGSFLDYAYTSLQLYLPFIGSVDIDISECMNGTINVQYTIDYFTGQCVANVLCTKTLLTPSGRQLGNVHAQHSFQGNCASQIPLSRTDYGAMVGNLINACTQAMTNPAGAVINLAENALSGGFKPNTTTKGNIVANSGFCSVLYPYVRITRPITAEPDKYQDVLGYPSYIDTHLGACQGACIVEDIDLTNITGATESEINRIKQMCREGIFI